MRDGLGGDTEPGTNPARRNSSTSSFTPHSPRLSLGFVGVVVLFDVFARGEEIVVVLKTFCLIYVWVWAVEPIFKFS